MKNWENGVQARTHNTITSIIYSSETDLYCSDSWRTSSTLVAVIASDPHILFYKCPQVWQQGNKATAIVHS
jgi:hypothetical protein